MRRIVLLCSVFLCPLWMAGCQTEPVEPPYLEVTPSSPDQDPTDQAVSEAVPATATVMLYTDFSGGNADNSDLISAHSFTFTGELTPVVLADGLSELTGLDFTLKGYKFSDGGAIILDWSPESTLLAGLDDRQQKDDFHFFDAESLNWFMLDSLARTIQEMYGAQEVLYTMDGGQELDVPEMPVWAVFPLSVPYQFSPFYYAHSDVQGDDASEPDSDEGQEEFATAMGLLQDMLGDRFVEGTAIVHTGEETINGELCWTFAFGQNSDENFVAEEHYAVNAAGKVYQIDNASTINRYELISPS